MALSHPSWTVDTTFSGKNIATAASVYTFTAAADAKVQITVKLTNAAGNGDYVIYLKRQWLGTGTASVVLPKTTCPAAAGETVIEFVSLELSVKATDVVDVMIDGLAGDTSVSGAIRISADNPSVFQAGDVTIPSASDNATAAAAAILVTPANKLATDASGNASANVTLWKGDTPASLDVDGNVPTAGGGLTAQETADALLLAPSGAAADGSAMAQLSNIAANTAVCASVAANSTDATAAGAITRKRGNSWSIALTLGEVTGYTSLWFTIKSSYDDADSAALLHVKLNNPSASDGLLYVNGAAAADSTKGSITVSDASTGAIIVAVDETITDDLAPGTYYYDAQALIDGDVTTPDSGTFTITADVTRSVV